MDDFSKVISKCRICGEIAQDSSIIGTTCKQHTSEVQKIFNEGKIIGVTVFKYELETAYSNLYGFRKALDFMQNQFKE